MKAKKILAGACASLMLAMTTATAVSAADTVNVTIGNATAEAGGKFSVDIDLSGIPAAGINGCEFGVKFDSTVLTVTNVKAGELAVEDATSLEGVNTLETNIQSGLVSVIYGLADTNSYITGEGTFLTLEGTVSNTAAAGKYDIELVAIDRVAGTDGTATNTDIIFGNLADDNVTYTVYTPTITDGWVEVTGDSSTESTEGTTVEIGEPTMLGDVNLDGAIGVADISTLAKYNVNPDVYSLSGVAIANADVTKDAKVDGLDLNAIIEYCLKSISEF
ncbi:MAG: hypothetical protein IJA12_08425 [Oscillospiraceae bacterium]|nr:hypothetical protein [Oscillospiraceae bacterium]